MEDRKNILKRRKLYNTILEKTTLPEFEDLKQAILNDDEEKVKALMSKSAKRIDRMGIVNPHLGRQLAKQQLDNIINKELPEFKNMPYEELSKMMGVDPNDVKIKEEVVPGARGLIKYNGGKLSNISIDPDLSDSQKRIVLAHELKHKLEYPEKFIHKENIDDVMGKFTAQDIIKDPIGVSQKALKGHHLSGLFEFDNLRHLIKSGRFKAAAPFLAKAGLAGAGGLASLAAEAAQEASDAESLGATPNMPEHYLERGVRDPEEARQKALAHSFKESLEGKEDSEMPSRFEKPEIQKYKEDVLKAKQEDLLPNYVEELPEEKKQNFNKVLNILKK